MKTNRKIATCPRCGRLEKVAVENELASCGVCSLQRAMGLDRQPQRDLSGEAIRQARERRGLSLRKAARELRLTPQYLSLVELGKKPVSTRVYEWASR